MLSSVRLSLKCLRVIKHQQNLRKVLPTLSTKRCLHTSCCLNDFEEDRRSSVSLFALAKKHKNKEKDTYLNVVYTYQNQPERKTGHVQFMYAAMRYMDEFGVNEDLEVYKAILDTLPKGRYVCRTLLQAEFMHYPREQQCVIDLLEKMEDNGVVPDPETEQMVINIFGMHAIPLRKLRRMAYWQGKFKNLNPWPWPKPAPTDALELAKMAISKIASVDVQSKISVFDTNDIAESVDKTWIVSASSPDQERLIAEHPKDVAAYVEGPWKVWVAKDSVDYFLLRADTLKKRPADQYDNDDVSNVDINVWKRNRKALTDCRRSIHEQDEQTIFGVCATGTSSKDSLLSWIRCLQPRNPALEHIPILFRFTNVVNEQQQIEASASTEPKKISEEGSKIET